LTSKFLRRRKFIVNQQVQYSLLFISLCYVLCFVIVLSASLFLPPILELGRVDPLSHRANEAAGKLLFLHSNFWPVALLSMFLIALHSIYTSHKIAGPIYRFHRIFESIGKGKLPKPARLRKGDYLRKEMEAVNQMVEALRTGVMEVQETQKILSASVREYCEMEVEASAAQYRERFRDLKVKGDQLEIALAKFEIEQ
jgi:hypothetical protein